MPAPRVCQRCRLPWAVTYRNTTLRYNAVCAICVRQLQSAKPWKRLHFMWAPYDLWVGAYYDKHRRVWYICLVPTMAIIYERRIPIYDRYHQPWIQQPPEA